MTGYACTYCGRERWSTARGFVGHVLMEHPSDVYRAWLPRPALTPCGGW